MVPVPTARQSERGGWKDPGGNKAPEALTLQTRVVDILPFSGYTPEVCLSLCSRVLCACCVLWTGGSGGPLTSATICRALPLCPLPAYMGRVTRAP